MYRTRSRSSLPQPGAGTPWVSMTRKGEYVRIETCMCSGTSGVELSHDAVPAELDSQAPHKDQGQGHHAPRTDRRNLFRFRLFPFQGPADLWTTQTAFPERDYPAECRTAIPRRLHACLFAPVIQAAGYNVAAPRIFGARLPAPARCTVLHDPATAIVPVAADRRAQGRRRSRKPYRGYGDGEQTDDASNGFHFTPRRI